MKRIFITLLLAIIPVFANAQWQIEQTQADELKGTVASTFFFYMDGDYSFMFDNNSKQLMVNTESGIFDYESYGGLHSVDALIGLYKDGALVEKFTSTLLMTKDESSSAMLADVEKVKKVLYWLRDTGNVRFIIDRYGKSDFDLTVPRNSKIKNVLLK